jgi:hypothetical protein
MDQSLSGGSTPSRMTLAVICLVRESSDMTETLYHRSVYERFDCHHLKCWLASRRSYHEQVASGLLFFRAMSVLQKLMPSASQL